MKKMEIMAVSAEENEHGAIEIKAHPLTAVRKDDDEDKNISRIFLLPDHFFGLTLLFDVCEQCEEDDHSYTTVVVCDIHGNPLRKIGFGSREDSRNIQARFLTPLRIVTITTIGSEKSTKIIVKKHRIVTSRNGYVAIKDATVCNIEPNQKTPAKALPYADAIEAAKKKSMSWTSEIMRVRPQFVA